MHEPPQGAAGPVGFREVILGPSRPTDPQFTPLTMLPHFLPPTPQPSRRLQPAQVQVCKTLLLLMLLSGTHLPQIHMWPTPSPPSNLLKCHLLSHHPFKIATCFPAPPPCFKLLVSLALLFSPKDLITFSHSVDQHHDTT